MTGKHGDKNERTDDQTEEPTDKKVELLLFFLSKLQAQ